MEYGGVGKGVPWQMAEKDTACLTGESRFMDAKQASYVRQKRAWKRRQVGYIRALATP